MKLKWVCKYLKLQWSAVQKLYDAQNKWTILAPIAGAPVCVEAFVEAIPNWKLVPGAGAGAAMKPEAGLVVPEGFATALPKKKVTLRY